ncbi:MAG: hypothetical protein ABH859_04215 [Pseudomonadota bacterium]
MLTLIKDNKGVTIVAALIAVFLLATLGAGVSYFIASNQATRIQQITGDQSFYTVQAGMEFALGQILEDDNNDTSITRHFSGETLSINRSGGNIIISASEGNAQSEHSITDPDPPTADCLQVDTSSAAFSGNNRLVGITLSRDAICDQAITITSMSGTTWEPDSGEGMNRIRIGGNPNEYDGAAVGSGGVWDFGSNDYVINNSSVHNLTELRWDTDITNHNFQLHFNYSYDGSDYSKVVPVDFLADDQASCFSWNTGSSRLTWTWSQWLRLTGTTMSNGCEDPIVVDRLIPSWTPVLPGRTLDEIRIDGVSSWMSLNSGEELNVNYVVPASATSVINWFTFSSEMLGRNYSLTWIFSDGTMAVTPLNLFGANQQDCLNIDTSGAYLDNTYIRGITFQNTCAADIGMTGITMSWVGESGRRFTESRVQDTDGYNTYYSNASSGALVDLGDEDLYIRNEDGLRNIDYLRFNNTVTAGLEFTLTFTMSDGNTKAVTFTPGTQAQNLVVNLAGANIGGASDRDLLGITISNSGSGVISWDRAIVSWSPLTPSRNMTQIRVGNTNVWSGSTGSGNNVNITNINLNPGQTLPITRIRYNSDMSGRTFTIEFIMADGSSYIIDPITPPDG